MRRLVMAAVATLGAALLCAAAHAAPVNITDPKGPNGGVLTELTGDTDANHWGLKSLGISALSLATGATAGNPPNFFADLSTYAHATLLLTWDPADSSNIAIGLTLYNKESGAWGAYDTPVLMPFRQQGSNPAAAADTTGALAFIINGQLARPTFYIMRNATAPVAGTYTLTALSRTPIIVPAAAGVAVNLDAVCGSWSNLGLLLTNCNGNTVDQIKAVLWVSR